MCKKVPFVLYSSAANPAVVVDNHNPELDLSCELVSHYDKANTVEISRDYDAESLEISFKRTIRVPDNKESSYLPPNLGSFQLFEVSKYKNMLPHKMAAKGGLFFPMYQREAMWIKFTSSDIFAIKIFVGGINAVSGELDPENVATKLRRLELLRAGGSVQDYLVTPEQLWLDGIATTQNRVRQFVAMPTGSGYSVEAQITGADVVSGLQFEITPRLPPTDSKPITVFVLTLTGKKITLRVRSESTVMAVKKFVQNEEGIPPDQQRLIFAGRQLEDEHSIKRYGVEESTIIHLVLRLRGGGPPLPRSEDLESKAPEMAIAPGGLIKQSIVADPYPANIWDAKRTISFNVQILSAAVFQRVTGLGPPATPVNVATYARLGFPFFKMYAEDSSIAGDFGDIKSVKQMDAKMGKGKKNGKEAEDEESAQDFPLTILNPDGPRAPFRPVSKLKEMLENMKAVKF